MAVIVFDGFDGYSAVGSGNGGIGQKWSSWGSTGNSSITTNGRFPNSCAYVSGADFATWIGYTLGSAVSSFSAGLAIRWQGGLPNQDMTFMAFDSGGTYQVGLRVNVSTGLIEACRMTNRNTVAAVLGTSSTGFVLGNSALWYYVELECVISDTVGVMNVYLNDVNVLTLSGVDTRNGTPTSVNRVVIGNDTGNSNMKAIYLDDFYMTDTATRLGEQRVEQLIPNADTATKDWTASTGSDNYAMVDERQFSSTDYVQASTLNNQDLYDLSDLSSTPAAINAVQTNVWGTKTDATARAITTRLQSGGTNSDGSDLVLSTGGYMLQNRLFLTDPNTGIAWAESGVNALKVGPRVTL